MMVLYANDLFIIGVEKIISRCRVDVAIEFEIKDVGMMHYFLGLEVGLEVW